MNDDAEKKGENGRTEDMLSSKLQCKNSGYKSFLL